VLDGGLGLLFAWWGSDFLLAVVSPNHPPIPPDSRIVAFTAAVFLLTGVLLGLAPAFRATRVDLNPLKENARNVGCLRKHKMALQQQQQTGTITWPFGSIYGSSHTTTASNGPYRN
jgi:hypothetical protein